MANPVVNERICESAGSQCVPVGRALDPGREFDSLSGAHIHFLLFVESTTTTTDHRYHYYYVSARARDSELISLVHCS